MVDSKGNLREFEFAGPWANYISAGIKEERGAYRMPDEICRNMGGL